MLNNKCSPISFLRNSFLWQRRFVLLLPCMLAQQAIAAENMTDALIGRLIEQQLPTMLYQHKDKPWELGTYSVTVNKAGASRFVSTTKQLETAMPLNVVISGTISQAFMGETMNIPCHSQFVTQGKLNIVPLLKPDHVEVSVAIDIPIPNPSLNCGSFQLPIKIPLEQLVADNKAQWQQQVAAEINTLFKQYGLQN
ncbi:MAG: DUF4403 family protein [Spongiibacteraceae bacterium]